MELPVFDALNQYTAGDPARLHMPGHKGRLAFPPLSLDVTELDETGNLFAEDGAFARSARLAAEVYGAGGAAYSAGGSTLYIQGMIAHFLAGKKKIVLQRSCHRSAANTAALLGLEPVWLCAREPAALMEELKTVIGTADAVLLTSPDYFGRCLPLEAASELCKKRGIPLLTDAAHGAHFPVAGLPDPLAAGADAVCVSLHKTLPALTGAALVLTRRAEDAGAIRRVMSCFGSSSPSFLIALSAERAALTLPESRPRWEELRRRTRPLHAHSCVLKNDDFSKLWIALNGADPETVTGLLRRERLSAELRDAGQLLFLLTPENTPDELERVDRFLTALDALHPTPPDEPEVRLPTLRMAPHEAFCARTERLSPEDAVGRICARTVNVCPPCSCLLCCGEEIDRATAVFLKSTGISRVDVVK